MFSSIRLVVSMNYWFVTDGRTGGHTTTGNVLRLRTFLTKKFSRFTFQCFISSEHFRAMDIDYNRIKVQQSNCWLQANRPALMKPIRAVD